MNPDTNRFEPLLLRLDASPPKLLRADGTPVPDTWLRFQVGELVVIKEYTFRVGWIGETAILFEPVGVPDLGRGGVQP